jgi:hypothetical protein
LIPVDLLNAIPRLLCILDWRALAATSADSNVRLVTSSSWYSR